MSINIAIDFDGVIHSYTSGWQGHRYIPDLPVEGAKDAILGYMKAGFRIVIYTTRAETAIGKAAVEEWLHDYCFPGGIEVTATKPPASIYIDDRGFCFQGVFPDPEFIRNFRPWNK